MERYDEELPDPVTDTLPEAGVELDQTQGAGDHTDEDRQPTQGAWAVPEGYGDDAGATEEEDLDDTPQLIDPELSPPTSVSPDESALSGLRNNIEDGKDLPRPELDAEPEFHEYKPLRHTPRHQAPERKPEPAAEHVRPPRTETRQTETREPQAETPPPQSQALREDTRPRSRTYQEVRGQQEPREPREPREHQERVHVREVHEQEVPEIDPRDLAFDDRLAMHRRVLLLNGKPEVRESGLYHTLAANVTDLAEQNKTDPVGRSGRTIAIVDWGSPSQPPLSERLLSQWTKVIPTNLMDHNGILSTLKKPEQMAAVIAASLNAEDPRAGMVLQDLLYDGIKALSELPDPRTGEARTGAVSAYEVRDMLRLWGGDLSLPMSGIFRTPTLGREARKAIEDAVPPPRLERHASYLEVGRVFMNSAVGRDTPEGLHDATPLGRRRELAAQQDEATQQPAPGGITILSSRLGEGDTYQLWARRQIAANMLLPVVQNAGPRLGALVLKNLDKAPNLAPVGQAMDQVTDNGGNVIISTRVTEPVVPHLHSADAIAMFRPVPTSNEAALTAPLTGQRERVNISETYGRQGGLNVSDSGSKSDTFDNFTGVGRKNTRGDVKSSSDTDSLGTGGSLSSSDGTTVSYAPGPHISETDQNKMAPLEVVVVDEQGSHAYHVGTREYTRDFPPMPVIDRSPTEEINRARTYVARGMQDALDQGIGRDAKGELPPKPMPPVAPGIAAAGNTHPYQHQQEFNIGYADYRRSLERLPREERAEFGVLSKPEWVYDQYRNQVLGMIDEYREYREQHGGRPDFPSFAEWTRGEARAEVWAENRGVLTPALTRIIERERAIREQRLTQRAAEREAAQQPRSVGAEEPRRQVAPPAADPSAIAGTVQDFARRQGGRLRGLLGRVTYRENKDQDQD